MKRRATERAVMRAVGHDIRKSLRVIYDSVDPTPEQRAAVSCSKGCAACCRLLVSVSFEEGGAIVTAHLDKLARVAGRLAEDGAVLAEIMRKHGMDTRSPLVDPAGYDRRNGAVASEWLALQRPCVFLEADGSCGIYENRPLSCRTLFAVSPAELCEIDYGTRSALPGEHVIAVTPDPQQHAMSALAAYAHRAAGSFLYGYLPIVVSHIYQMWVRGRSFRPAPAEVLADRERG